MKDLKSEIVIGVISGVFAGLIVVLAQCIAAIKEQPCNFALIFSISIAIVIIIVIIVVAMNSKKSKKTKK